MERLSNDDVEIHLVNVLAVSETEEDPEAALEALMTSLDPTLNAADAVRKKLVELGWSWEAAESAAIEMLKRMMPDA